MKRILYITTDSWWDTDVTIIPQLAEKYNVEVFVASMAVRNKNKYIEKSVPQNVVLHDLHIVRTQKNPLMFFVSIYYFFRLLFALPNKDYVIWVIDGIVYYSWPFSLFCSKEKTILSLHNYEEHIGGKKSLFDLKSYLLERYKYFHFHSAIQKNLFLKDYDGKAAFSTNMPLKFFGTPQVGLPHLFSKSQRSFLFLGMIKDYKRPDMFLRCANQFPEANFMIAGYTENPSKYEQYLSSNHKNLYVNFKFLTNEEIANYFSLADFLVLPYDDATQSGPLLTAFAYNVPVIASDQPIFKQMITDKEDGYLFTAGSQVDLNECVRQAININEEKFIEMRKNLQRKTYKYAETTNFADALSKFISTIYNE